MQKHLSRTQVVPLIAYMPSSEPAREMEQRIRNDARRASYDAKILSLNANQAAGCRIRLSWLRGEAVRRLVERKALAAGCNEDDITRGKHIATVEFKNKGASAFRAIQLGIAAAHESMDKRTNKEA